MKRSMRALIFGGTGMVGRALVAQARERGWPALALSREEADVTDPAALRYWVATFRPEVVFNCAAFTKVDACEGEAERAHRVNGRAVGHVAEASSVGRAFLVHLSTDYIFDGSSTRPYREEDTPDPLSVYGQSKLEGERQALAYADALVVRSSWLFGSGGPNFVFSLLDQMRRGVRQLRVVADQLGCPTYVPFLARALCDLAAVRPRGVLHFRNREPVSWHDFAVEIARLWDRTVEVLPVTTAEYPRPARRPAYAVLDVGRVEEVLGRRVEPWGWGLAELLTAMGEGGR